MTTTSSAPHDSTTVSLGRSTVQGGSATASRGATPLFARITVTEIDEAEVRQAVAGDDRGAVVMFAGVVRNHDGGRQVRALDYRAHPDAEAFLARCVEAESERTGLALAAVHRVGALDIGDAALVVAAASAHRPEAFAAVEALTARIKEEVPIWKRQHFDDGASEWVGL